MTPLLPQNHVNSPRPQPRAGISMLEMVVASILLSAVMTILVPTVGWLGVHNRLAQQRQEALAGLDNLMDELSARPYGELTPEAVGKIKLPEPLGRQLPGATLQTELTEPEPGTKRLTLRLAWNQRNGTPLAPLRLTAWVHRREGQP